MNGIMKGGVVIEPIAVQKMKEKTDYLGEELKKTAKNLLNRKEELNKKGFQDGNFEQLNFVIDENKKNLDKLEKVMNTFSEYLEHVKKNADDLINGPKMKSSSINIR